MIGVSKFHLFILHFRAVSFVLPLSLPDAALLIFTFLTIPIWCRLLSLQRNKEAARPLQSQNPIERLQLELQAVSRKIRWFRLCLHHLFITLALAKMIKFPTIWEHFREMSTARRHHSHFCNMRTQIEHKCMEAGTKANWWGHSQKNPIQHENNKHLQRLR